MRYRGGGVGHTYMRAIETWLTETGWGSDDVLISADKDVDSDEDHSNNPGDEDHGNNPGDEDHGNNPGDKDRGNQEVEDPGDGPGNEEGDRAGGNLEDEVSQNEEGYRTGENSEDEVFIGEGEDGYADSDQESLSEVDTDLEYSSEEDEVTADGAHGYSGF